jgi:hypothetical protein
VGGYGSGRPPWSRRRKVERCVRLPIQAFTRRNHRFLRAGCRTEGECFPSIPQTDTKLVIAFLFDTQSPDPSYTLHYRAPVTDEPVTVQGALLWTMAGSGRRVWFGCPECESRRGVLYLPPGESRFACRGCYRLRYAYEDLAARERFKVRAKRFYEKAGSRSEGLEFTPRPKGMRRRTFARYMDKAKELERRGWALAPCPRLVPPKMAGTKEPVTRHSSEQRAWPIPQ